MFKIEIDFFEFSFLVEACIPPRPIARAMFWKNVINKQYHKMSKDERKSLYKWIGRNPNYINELEKGNEDCLWFEKRFNPDNQYLVTTDYAGEIEDIETFLFKERYYTEIDKWVAEECIIDIKKIENE